MDPTNGGNTPPTEIQIVLTYDIRTKDVSMTGPTDVVLALGILGVGQAIALRQLGAPRGKEPSGLVVARAAVPPYLGRKL